MAFFKTKENKTNNIEEKIKDLLLNNEIVENCTSGITDHVFLTNKRVIILSLNIKESAETYTSIPYKNICSIDLIKKQTKLTNVGDILAINGINKNVAVNINDLITVSKMIMDKIA